MAERRAPLIFVNLGHAYDHLFMLLFPTVILTLEHAWQRPYDELLTLAVGGFIAFGAGTLPAGWLGDRWSRSGMLAVFFFGIGVASLLTGLARTPLELAAGLTLIGLFASIYHPIGSALVVENTARIGRALGINGVWGNMGVAVAALVAGALSDWYGWRAAFMVPGVLALLTGVVYVACLRSAGAARPAVAAPPAPPIRRDAQRRVFIVLLVAALCGGLIFNAVIVAMPKLFEARLGGLADSALGIGGVLMVVYAIAAFTQILVGHLIDTRPIKLVFIAILVCQAPVLLIAGSLSGGPLFVASLVAMALIFGEIPIHDALVARYTTSAWRSRVYAVMYLVGFGASALAVPLVALVYRATGDFTWLFVIYAALVLVIAGAALMLPTMPRVADGQAVPTPL